MSCSAESGGPDGPTSDFVTTDSRDCQFVDRLESVCTLPPPSTRRRDVVQRSTPHFGPKPQKCVGVGAHSALVRVTLGTASPAAASADGHGTRRQAHGHSCTTCSSGRPSTLVAAAAFFVRGAAVDHRPPTHRPTLYIYSCVNTQMSDCRLVA